MAVGAEQVIDIEVERRVVKAVGGLEGVRE